MYSLTPWIPQEKGLSWIFVDAWLLSPIKLYQLNDKRFQLWAFDLPNTDKMFLTFIEMKSVYVWMHHYAS